MYVEAVQIASGPIKGLKGQIVSAQRPLTKGLQAKSLLSSPFVLNILERMTSPLRGSQSKHENIFGPKKKEKSRNFPISYLQSYLCTGRKKSQKEDCFSL